MATEIETLQAPPSIPAELKVEGETFYSIACYKERTYGLPEAHEKCKDKKCACEGHPKTPTSLEEVVTQAVAGVALA